MSELAVDRFSVNYAGLHVQDLVYICDISADLAHNTMHGAPGSNEAQQFCNAFWGENDAGFNVIQSHSKNTFKTLEDLRTFYKERYVATNKRGYRTRVLQATCQTCKVCVRPL